MNKAIRECIEGYDQCTGENEEEAKAYLSGGLPNTSGVYQAVSALLMGVDYGSKQAGLATVLGEMFSLLISAEEPSQAEMEHGEMISIEDHLAMLNAQIRLAYRTTMHFISKSRKDGTFPESQAPGSRPM